MRPGGRVVNNVRASRLAIVCDVVSKRLQDSGYDVLVTRLQESWSFDEDRMDWQVTIFVFGEERRCWIIDHDDASTIDGKIKELLDKEEWYQIANAKAVLDL